MKSTKELEQLAYDQEKRILFTKKNGRFVPASDPWAYNGLTPGFWLIWVRPGQTTIRHTVWPDCIATEAALMAVREELEKGLLKDSQLTPVVQKMSVKHMKAWTRYCKVAALEGCTTLNRKSIHDIVDSAIHLLRKRLENNFKEGT